MPSRTSPWAYSAQIIEESWACIRRSRDIIAASYADSSRPSHGRFSDVRTDIPEAPLAIETEPDPAPESVRHERGCPPGATPRREPS